MRLNKKGRKWDNKRWTNNLDPGSKLKIIWTSDQISNNADENNAHDDDDEEEVEEEDRVDLFVLFSSCCHLPVGHFFASSSPLSLCHQTGHRDNKDDQLLGRSRISDILMSGYF